VLETLFSVDDATVVREHLGCVSDQFAVSVFLSGIASQSWSINSPAVADSQLNAIVRAVRSISRVVRVSLARCPISINASGQNEGAIHGRTLCKTRLYTCKTSYPNNSSGRVDQYEGVATDGAATGIRSY
jgi:hypothetical protein